MHMTDQNLQYVSKHVWKALKCPDLASRLGRRCPLPHSSTPRRLWRLDPRCVRCAPQPCPPTFQTKLTPLHNSLGRHAQRYNGFNTEKKEVLHIYHFRFIVINVRPVKFFTAYVKIEPLNGCCCSRHNLQQN